MVGMLTSSFPWAFWLLGFLQTQRNRKKPNQLFLSLLVLLLKKLDEFLTFPLLQSHSALEFFFKYIKIILG